MNTKTEDFYNKLSFLYPLIDVFLKPQKRVLFKQINQLPDGKLLEIGVGNGAHLHLYKRHQIVGIDTSAAMLDNARKQNNSNVQLIKMDGTDLQFADEEFDYVVLSHVIAVVTNPEQLMCEVLRVLKPQGRVFILNHFTPENWLKYVDIAFSALSPVFHFRSVFYIETIAAIQHFNLVKEFRFGVMSYFKLLIYQKP